MMKPLVPDTLVLPAIARLIEYNSRSLTPIYLSISTCGAGFTLANWLFSQPGASQLVLSLDFPYNRHSILTALNSFESDRVFPLAGKETAGKTGQQRVVSGEKGGGTKKDGKDRVPTQWSKVGFCSPEMAEVLADYGRNKGLKAVCMESGVSSLFNCMSGETSVAKFEAMKEGKRPIVLGVGMTGVVATSYGQSKGSRCFVCISDSYGRKTRHSLEMKPDVTYSRVEQDRMLCHLVLTAIFRYYNSVRLMSPSLDLGSFGEIKFKHFKELGLGGVAVGPESKIKDVTQLVNEEVTSVLNAEKTHCMLVPVLSYGTAAASARASKQATSQRQLRVLQYVTPYFPFDIGYSNFIKSTFKLKRRSDPGREDQSFDVVVLCGSFNPLHLGHEKMANFAVQYVEAMNVKQGIDKEVLLMYELSVRNPDKGAISYITVKQRLDQFVATRTHRFDNSLAEELADDVYFDFNNKLGPYPVVLTNEDFSRFLEKSHILKGCYLALGYDTAVRVVDKKYYNNSEEEMLQCLLQMKQNKVRIIVFGRLNKTSNTFEDFTHARSQLNALFKDMFFVVTQEEFRYDLSSTEVRNAKQSS